MAIKRTVTATDFKAKCLSLLDEAQNGEEILVLRRGQPVAVLGPPPRAAWKSLRNSWVGRMEIRGDIVGDMADLWDVTREE